MTDLSTISNTTIRAEIEEFVSKPNELARYVGIFSKAHPRMQAIAATVIEGEHHQTEKLTREALDAGHPALEIMDNGRIAEQGAPNDLLGRPSSARLKEFLGNAHL